MRRITFSYLLIASIAAFTSDTEFQINTHTSNDQKLAAIAMNAVGNFIVVWSSYLQDGNSNGIFGRCFDPNCSPIVNEFQVNTTTTGNQTAPSVAKNGAGNFIVTWQGPGADDDDIFIQRFDPNGQPLGDEFLVNSLTANRQRVPKVAINDAGRFVVVWESEKIQGKTSTWVTSCRLFDVNGLAIGDDFEANLLTDCRYPDVVMDPNGNFSVIWVQDRSSNSIIARLYNSDGTAKTEPFEVSTIKFSSLTRPSIAMNDSVHFIVTWDGDPETEKQDDIHARLFEPNGAAMGEQFIVNTTLDGKQQNPQVAMSNKGEFVIVWESEIDTNGRDIFARQYDSSGAPIGDEFLINTYIKGDQQNPDIAIRETGEFVTVWQSDGQDGSDWGIFGSTERVKMDERREPREKL